MNESENPLELRGVLPPEPLLPSPGLPAWAWFALSAGVLLAALTAIVIIRLVRKGGRLGSPSLRELSYRQALAALQSISPDRIQEAATQVSSALRRYLAGACGDPALYETHEEFIGRHQALAAYPDDVRAGTSEAFSHLALLKYGPEAHGDPQALAAEARDLLEKLHRHAPAA